MAIADVDGISLGLKKLDAVRGQPCTMGLKDEARPGMYQEQIRTGKKTPLVSPLVRFYGSYFASSFIGSTLILVSITL